MKDMNTGKCWHRWTIRTGVAAIAIAVALPAVAQNYQQSRQQQRLSQQRDWDRQQNQRDSQQRQRQNRQDEQQSQLMHIDPQAWIRVGYDFNRDGRVDAVEDVFAFELQQVKVRSDEHRKRMQHDQPSRQGQHRADRDRSSSHPSDMSPAVWDRQRQQRAMQQRNQQRSALRTIQGSVSSIHNQSISGHEHEHTLVKTNAVLQQAHHDSVENPGTAGILPAIDPPQPPPTPKPIWSAAAAPHTTPSATAKIQTPHQHPKPTPWTPLPLSLPEPLTSGQRSRQRIGDPDQASMRRHHTPIQTLDTFKPFAKFYQQVRNNPVYLA